MQPAQWTKDVDKITCPDIDAIQNYVEHNQEALLGAWVFAHKVETLFTRNSEGNVFWCCCYVSLVALAQEGSESSESSKSDDAREGEAIDAMADDKHKRGTGAKPPWPKGITIDSYKFKHKNLHLSKHMPNSECFICTNLKHVTQDCSHYGCWSWRRSDGWTNCFPSSRIDQIVIWMSTIQCHRDLRV
ncbi:hypothetical protein B0H19DRAFT_1065235 [Mycena capillaripes]|nr:hypothetical protein B0H19DRAFT_1065235 [Mycena capillaripes]